MPPVLHQQFSGSSMFAGLMPLLVFFTNSFPAHLCFAGEEHPAKAEHASIAWM